MRRIGGVHDDRFPIGPEKPPVDEEIARGALIHVHPDKRRIILDFSGHPVAAEPKHRAFVALLKKVRAEVAFVQVILGVLFCVLADGFVDEFAQTINSCSLGIVPHGQLQSVGLPWFVPYRSTEAPARRHFPQSHFQRCIIVKNPGRFHRRRLGPIGAGGHPAKRPDRDLGKVNLVHVDDAEFVHFQNCCLAAKYCLGGVMTCVYSYRAEDKLWDIRRSWRAGEVTRGIMLVDKDDGSLY